MALPFERVNTRKIALAAKYGYAANEVAEDGIDEGGITVLVAAYDRERKPSNMASYESDSAVTRVQWDNEQQADEARKARDDDWAETLELRGLIHKHPDMQ